MHMFFLMVGCAVGLAFMAAGGPAFYYSLFVSRWKKVPGRVVHTAIEEYINTSEGMTKRRFNARVDYEYHYAGIVRRGEHYFMRHYEETREESQARLDAFPLGLELDVCVYADRPSKSTLTPGINYASLAYLLFGIVVFGLSLLAMQIGE